MRSIKDTPVSVGEVRLSGLDKTRQSVILEELASARKCRTLGGLNDALESAVVNLKDMGAFEGVNILMDAGQKSNLVDLDVRVRERSRLGVTVGGYSSEAGQLQVTMGGEIRNPLGLGDFLKGTYNRALKGNTAALSYTKPRIFGEPLRMDMTARDEVVDLEYLASHRQQIRGVGLAVSTHDGRHKAQYKFDLREAVPRTLPREDDPLMESSTPMQNCQETISREMRNEIERGASDKSALAYTFVHDRRDHRVCPTNGSYFSATTELAGLTGDAKFVKGLMDVQYNVPIYPSPIAGAAPFALSVATSLGLVRPLPNIRELLGGTGRVLGSESVSTGRSTLRVFDRLHLGGPANVRGFEMQGIGPRAQGGSRTGDSLGGDISWRWMASLSGPIPVPRLAENGVRLHAFFNAGNLVTWNELIKGSSLDVMPIGRCLRASAGVGTYLSLGNVARLEFNYSWVLRQEPQDITKNFQIGIGVQI